MKYNAALFDMDGVILDSEPLHVAAFQTTLGEYGHKLTEEDYKRHFAGKTDEEGFRRYFQFFNEAVDLHIVMDQKSKAYVSLATDQLAPYPGVPSLIKKLATRIPIALVTGSLKLEAEIALEACDITDCFTAIIAAEDVSKGKPDPEGYLKAVAALNTQIAKCVVIEDSPSGVMAANAAGIYCIAVTTTHKAEELRLADEIVDQLDIALFES